MPDWLAWMLCICLVWYGVIYAVLAFMKRRSRVTAPAETEDSSEG